MKLLIVEDNESDAQLIVYAMRGVAANEDIHIVASRAELVALLATESVYDAVILDYWLPSLGWPESMHMARNRWPDIPVIVVSGALPEDRGTDALQAGADDYVSKDHLEYLPHAVRREVVKRVSRQVRQQVTSKLREAPRVIHAAGEDAVEVTLDQDGRLTPITTPATVTVRIEQG